MLRNRDDDSIRIVKDITVRAEEEEEFNIDNLIEDGEVVSVVVEENSREVKKD